MYLTKLNNFSNIIDRIFDDFYEPMNGSVRFNDNFFIKNENGYELELLLPGLNKENLKVEIEDGILKINGEFKSSVNSYKINRSYKLGDDIDTSKIDADIKDGVLSIKMPLIQDKKKQKKIELI